MHYSTMLRLKDKDVALCEQAPRDPPAHAGGDLLKVFRVPLGPPPLDVLFRVYHMLTGLQYNAGLVMRDGISQPPNAGGWRVLMVPLRGVHRFTYAADEFSVRLLSMREG